MHWVFFFLGAAALMHAQSAFAQPYANTVHVSSVAGLQDAAFNLGSNTEVLIADGTYVLTNTLVIDDVHDVAFRSESGNRDAVIIVGQGMGNSQYGNVPHGFLVQNVQDILIADLTLRDFYYHSVIIQGEQGAQRPILRNIHSIDAGEQHIKVTLGSNEWHCDGGVVESCLIEFTTTARSDYTNGVDVLAGFDWIVRDCTFRNIRGPDGTLAGPTVLFWRGAGNTIVERNRFFNCQRGIALGLVSSTTNDHMGGIARNNFFHRAADETGDVGIAVASCPGFQILHNTVILNGTFDWNIEHRYLESSGEIAYNITDGPIIERNTSHATLTGNLTSAQSEWFIDMTNGDLHLTESALSALNAALPLTAVTDDIDRESRSSTPDIGADEHQPIATEAAGLLVW